MAGTPPLIPPLTTDNPIPTPTGTGGSAPGGTATASGLYLYTFLATLVILLGISLAVILRTTYRRRRMRIMIANGTWIPPNMNASTDFVGEFADDDDEGVPLGPGAFGTAGWRAGGGGARGRGRGRRRERERLWTVKPSLFDVMLVVEKEKGEKDHVMKASKWGDFMPISATLVPPSPLSPNSNTNPTSQTPNTNTSPPQPAPIPIPQPVDRHGPSRTTRGSLIFTRTFFGRARAPVAAQDPLPMDVMTNTNTRNAADNSTSVLTPQSTPTPMADRSIRVVFLVAMPSPTSPTSSSTSSAKHDHKHDDNDNDTDDTDSDDTGEQGSQKGKGEEGVGGEGDGEIPPVELGVVHLCLPPPAKTKTMEKAETSTGEENV